MSSAHDRSVDSPGFVVIVPEFLMPRFPLLAVAILANLVAMGYADELAIESHEQGFEQSPAIVTSVAEIADHDVFTCSSNRERLDFSDCCSQGCYRHGDIWTREHLMNGFWGLQPALAEHGIVYDAQLTQFYQGVANGGREQVFEYGGKLDQFMIFQGEKLGLWKGFEVVMHAETRFGNDVIAQAAPLAPVNVAMLYPSAEHDTAITGLQVLQALSEEWAITAGRINTVDLIQTIYPQTGRGIDGFMNTSTFLPLTLGVSVPLVFNGAGVIKLDEGRIQGGLVVLDPTNIPTVSGFDDMFSNGATILGLWRVFTDLGGRPGSHMFAGSWASSEFTSLNRHSWVIEPGGGIVPGRQTGSWSIQYVLEQQLWADCCNKNRNVGLLSEWGYADPETNPYEWICNVSLQANGLIRRREADSMGVAWFYNGLSSDVKDLLSPPLDIRDLTGVEVFYNAAVTPWFHLTADLQVVEPVERTSSNTAVVAGLRAKINL